MGGGWEGDGQEEGLETLTPPAQLAVLGGEKVTFAPPPSLSGCEAPSPGLALTAWEAGWLGGAPGLVITGLPLSPPPGQLLAPPHGLRLGYRPHLPLALVPASNSFGLSSWLSDWARSCPSARGLMEQLVRGSVPWTHPSLQPRAPAWHRLSAALNSVGRTEPSETEELDRVGWSPRRRKIPQSSCLPRGFWNLKNPTPTLIFPPSEYRNPKAKSPWPLNLAWAMPLDRVSLQTRPP